MSRELNEVREGGREHATFWDESGPGRGNSKCKSPEAGVSLASL